MPSGTVNVFDDGYFVGSVDVNFGMGSMTFFLLDAGSHSLTASFLAHDTYDGSTGELTLVVNKADSTTTVSTACMTKFVEFQPFTVSATVSWSVGGFLPIGLVTFYDGDVPLCTAFYDSDATCTSNALAVAGSDTETSHNITASYEGDHNTNGSVSASPLAITVLSASDVVFRNDMETPAASCPIE